MQWQPLSLEQSLFPTSAPGIELQLCLLAQAADIQLVPSWVCLETRSQSEQVLSPAEIENSQWFMRPLKQGGEAPNSSRPMPVAANQPFLSAKADHLLQAWPLQIQAQGTLGIDPEYNQDQDWRHQSEQAEKSLEPHILEQIALWDAPSNPPELTTRLQKLSAQIRASVANEKVYLDWIDDGQTLWLTGIWPLERIEKQLNQWTLLAQEESLPPAPEPLLNSLFEQISENVAKAWRQSFLPEAEFQAFQIVQGQLYFNQSLFDTLQTKISQLSWQKWWQLSRKQAAHLNRQREYFLETFQVPHVGLSGYCRQLADIYTVFWGQSFRSQLLLNKGLAFLAQQGVLEPLQKTHLNPSSRIMIEFQNLRELAQTLLIKDPELKPDKFLRNPDFKKHWQLFVVQHGHRGLHEWMLSSDRFADRPELVLNCLLLPWQVFRSEPEKTWKTVLFRPLWRLLAHHLDLREHFRSDALWAIYQVRKQMQTLLDKAVAAGLLTESSDFWLLNLEEVQRLDRGEAVPAEYCQMLRQKWLAQQAYSPPVCKGDFDSLVTKPALNSENTENPMIYQHPQVLGLEDTRQGQIWNPHSESENLPEGFKPWLSVLVLRHLDPGSLVQILQSSAVILGQKTDLNGGLSLLREMGIPAVLGIENSLEIASTGQAVSIGPEKLELSPAASVSAEKSPAAQ
jgi:hypothetical protein